MAENAEISFGFEYKKSCTMITSTRPTILPKIREELRILTGADNEVLTIASRNRRAKCGTLGNKYCLLQRWMESWNMYVNIDSLDQVKSRDKLTVCEVVKHNDDCDRAATPNKVQYIANYEVVAFAVTFCQRLILNNEPRLTLYALGHLLLILCFRSEKFTSLVV